MASAEAAEIWALFREKKRLANGGVSAAELEGEDVGHVVQSPALKDAHALHEELMH